MLAPPKGLSAARVWLVTAGAQAVLTEDRISHPEAAVFWGLGRSIAAELPRHWGGLIDLDERFSPAEAATALAETLLHGPADEQLALRDQRRERPSEQRGLPTDRVGAEQQPHEQREHREHAGEAQLLGDHRQQEVGVRFRQIKQFLHARTESDAEPFAPAEGDEGVG